MGTALTFESSECQSLRKCSRPARTKEAQENTRERLNWGLLLPLGWGGEPGVARHGVAGAFLGQSCMDAPEVPFSTTPALDDRGSRARIRWHRRVDRQGAYRPQPALARPVLPCLPPGWVGVFVRDLLFGKEICTEKHGHRRRGGIVSVKACHAVKARD